MLSQYREVGGGVNFWRFYFLWCSALQGVRSDGGSNYFWDICMRRGPNKSGPPPGGGPVHLPPGVTRPHGLSVRTPRRTGTEDGLRDLSDGQNKHALSRPPPDKRGLVLPPAPTVWGVTFRGNSLDQGQRYTG